MHLLLGNHAFTPTRLDLLNGRLFAYLSFATCTSGHGWRSPCFSKNSGTFDWPVTETTALNKDNAAKTGGWELSEEITAYRCEYQKTRYNSLAEFTFGTDPEIDPQQQ